jgi:hypothetical protein
VRGARGSGAGGADRGAIREHEVPGGRRQPGGARRNPDGLRDWQTIAGQVVGENDLVDGEDPSGFTGGSKEDTPRDSILSDNDSPAATRTR